MPARPPGSPGVAGATNTVSPSRRALAPAARTRRKSSLRFKDRTAPIVMAPPTLRPTAARAAWFAGSSKSHALLGCASELGIHAFACAGAYWAGKCAWSRTPSDLLSPAPRTSIVHIAKSGGVWRSVRSIAALAFAHVEHGGARVCLLCLNVRLTPPNGRCLRYAALRSPLGSGCRGEGCADFPPASSPVDTGSGCLQRAALSTGVDKHVGSGPRADPLRQRVRRMSSRLRA